MGTKRNGMKEIEIEKQKKKWEKNRMKEQERMQERKKQKERKGETCPGCWI